MRDIRKAYEKARDRRIYILQLPKVGIEGLIESLAQGHKLVMEENRIIINCWGKDPVGYVEIEDVQQAYNQAITHVEGLRVGER